MRHLRLNLFLCGFCGSGFGSLLLGSSFARRGTAARRFLRSGLSDGFRGFCHLRFLRYGLAAQCAAAARLLGRFRFLRLGFFRRRHFKRQFAFVRSLAQQFISAAALFLKAAVVHQTAETALNQSVRVHREERLQLIDQGLAQGRSHELGIAVRAAERFADHLVDEAEFKESVGCESQSLSGFRSLVGALPENGCAPFRADHGIRGVLKHDERVAHGNGESSAGAAFADDRGDHGNAQFGKLIDVAADGFGLIALFRVNAGIGARGVDEREDRQTELFGKLHQTQSLAVAFGLGHAEVAARAFAAGDGSRGDSSAADDDSCRAGGVVGGARKGARVDHQFVRHSGATF